MTYLVAAFACKDDAKRVLRVLGKRMEKYGLRLHPDRSRMVDFRSPATVFNFLGLTHVWGKVTEGKGYAVVRQQTAKERFARALQNLKEKRSRSGAALIQQFTRFDPKSLKQSKKSCSAETPAHSKVKVRGLSRINR